MIFVPYSVRNRAEFLLLASYQERQAMAGCGLPSRKQAALWWIVRRQREARS